MALIFFHIFDNFNHYSDFLGHDVKGVKNIYRRDSEFIRLPCPYRTVSVPYRVRTVPYRTVPYRTVPRETVLVDRAAYHTFLTVFRDFCLKARTPTAI
jgi:hypothetical protein